MGQVAWRAARSTETEPTSTLVAKARSAAEIWMDDAVGLDNQSDEENQAAFPAFADSGRRFLKLLPTATARDKRLLVQVQSAIVSQLTRIEPEGSNLEKCAGGRRGTRALQYRNVSAEHADHAADMACPTRLEPRSAMDFSNLTPSGARRGARHSFSLKPFKDQYGAFAYKVGMRVLHSQLFQWTVTGATLLFPLVSFFDAWFEFPSSSDPVGRALDAAEGFVLAVFTFEIIAKVIARGSKPLDYFRCQNEGPHNTFDFGIVALSWLVFGTDNPLKVLPLLKLFRPMKAISQLRLLLNGMTVGLSSVINIMLILLILIYLVSIAGVTILGPNDPAHFGGVFIAMVTFVRIATFANLRDVFYINYHGCDKYDAGIYIQTNATLSEIQTRFGTFPGFDCYAPAAFPLFSITIFVGFSIVAGFVIVNLFVGVVTMGLFDELERYDTDWRTKLSRERRIEVKKLIFGPQGQTFIKQHMDGVFGGAVENVSGNVPNWYMLLSVRAQRAASSAAFNNFIIGLILIISILIGIQTNNETRWSQNTSRNPFSPTVGGMGLFAIFDIAALMAFSLEAIVKLVAEGANPCRYFQDNWNRFDFFVGECSASVICVTYEYFMRMTAFRVCLRSGFITLRFTVQH